jgi:chromatin assembly factor 1 subunit B
MRAKTLQIIWHAKDPVFSVDFHPDGYLATGGGDKDIKVRCWPPSPAHKQRAAARANCRARRRCCCPLLHKHRLRCLRACMNPNPDPTLQLWELQQDAEGTPNVRYMASLSGHSRTINCVRFSHTGGRCCVRVCVHAAVKRDLRASHARPLPHALRAALARPLVCDTQP